MANMTIHAIMSIWNEEDNVERAIKSTKDFVNKFIVVDNSDDATLDVVRSCKEKWNLDMDIHYRPDMPDLAKKRYWSFKQSNADWLLVVDGDHVYHTDGPNSLGTIVEQLPKYKNNSVWWSSSVYIYGLPGEFTKYKPIGVNGTPYLTPHPFLYKNSDSFFQTEKPTVDLPHVHHYEFVQCSNEPIFWDVCSKGKKRQFLRRYLVGWRSANNYTEYPTLESFARAQVAPEKLEDCLEGFWASEERALLPYNEKEWSYYPKVLREAM